MLIFEFSDYKRFLRYFIEQQPKRGRGLIKAMAEHLDADPSQVSQVLSGSKDFTEEHALLLCQFVGLNDLETEYFLTLIKIERSGTALLAEHYRKKRDKLKAESLNLSKRVNHDRILSDYEKSVFYSSYIYSAIRLSTSIGEGKTIGEVCELFQVSREKAAGILRFLSETNLCKEENGRYQMGTQHTHIERDSPFLTRHHHNWRIKALHRTDALSEQELQFTGPVSIGENEFQEIRELLVEAVNKALKKVKASEPTALACLLIDWFRLEN